MLIMALEFDGEHGVRLNSEPARLDVMFIIRRVVDMKSLDEVFIDSDEWGVDTDGKLWVNGKAPAYLEENLPDLYLSVGSDITRVIYIDEGDTPEEAVAGWIIDNSYDPFVTRVGGEKSKELGEDEPSHESIMLSGAKPALDKPRHLLREDVMKLPVIALAYDDVSLSAIKNALQRQFDVELDDNPIELFIDEFEDIEPIDDDDDEFDDGDDDTPDEPNDGPDSDDENTVEL
jgi:hypothetical protein